MHELVSKILLRNFEETLKRLLTQCFLIKFFKLSKTRLLHEFKALHFLQNHLEYFPEILGEMSKEKQRDVTRT